MHKHHHVEEKHIYNHEKKHKHEGGHEEIIKRKAIIATLISIPVVILSLKEFPYGNTLNLMLSTFIYLYGGTFFLKGFLEELKKKKPGMMTLVSLGISVSLNALLMKKALNGKTRHGR